MKILLTNDDGIDSVGLDALRRSLADEHEVWVLAPDGERSAMSHCITIKNPIRTRHVDERVFVCSGSPADCVIISMLGAIPIKPEMVIAGINIGPNLGTDIIYSGTVAAARQAAFMGIPGIAVSINTYIPPIHADPLAAFVAEHLAEFRKLWNPRHLININGPNAESPGPPEITHPSWRIYHDRLVRFDAPSGEAFFFIDGKPVETPLEPNSDWDAVSRGAISVSPIFLNPVDHHEDERYRQALFLGHGGERTE